MQMWIKRAAKPPFHTPIKMCKTIYITTIWTFIQKKNVISQL